MEPGSDGRASAYAVELAGVSKYYGSVAALEDISLQIRHGEFYTLLGPSGCGKTTTLNIIGHVVLTTPYVVLVVSSRLVGFDRRLEWAAADLGANPAATFRHVTFPLILPGILAGALFAFTLSLDEFVITLFTIGPQTTLPLYVFSQVKFGVTPKINALATLLLLGSVIILMLGIYALSRAGRPSTKG
jgi:ABC-type spermidine/putrescine transport system permease subunit II